MGKDGNGYSHSPYIFHAIKKYGSDNFEYEILAQCTDQLTADELENKYIIEYNSRDPEIGYNLKEGGSFGKHSEETKKKISATLSEQAAEWSPEKLEERSRPIREYWRGKKRGPHTEDWKKNNSIFMRKRHQENIHPMQGKHHSEEAKIKIRAANKGKKIDPKVLEKRGKARRRNLDKDNLVIELYQKGETIASNCKYM